jgi:prepilin peptidase CpaA
MLFISEISDVTTAVFQWGVVIGASLFAVVSDIRQRRIPNTLTIPLLAAGLIWAACFGGLSGLLEALGACGLLALPYVLLFIFVGGGAGDAKLMGAIGAWLGLRYGLVVLVCVLIAGGVLAIAKAISQKQVKFVLTSVFVSVYAFILFLTGHKKMRPAGNRTDIGRSDNLDVPYGVAIFAGVCTAAVIVGIWGIEWLW